MENTYLEDQQKQMKRFVRVLWVGILVFFLFIAGSSTLAYAALKSGALEKSIVSPLKKLFTHSSFNSFAPSPTPTLSSGGDTLVNNPTLTPSPTLKVTKSKTKNFYPTSIPTYSFPAGISYDEALKQQEEWFKNVQKQNDEFGRQSQQSLEDFRKQSEQNMKDFDSKAAQGLTDFQKQFGSP